MASQGHNHDEIPIHRQINSLNREVMDHIFPQKKKK